MSSCPTNKISHAAPWQRGCFFALFIFLVSACTPLPPETIIPENLTDVTGVEGVVRNTDGTVAAGAYVYAYRSAQAGLRGPADFGARVEADGRYFLDLVEGEYHLVARLRQSGADAGPPRPGDAWSIYRDNPLTIVPKEIVKIDFVLQGGSLPRQTRKGSLTTGDTGYRGRLVDAEGSPHPGALALAYRTADYHRMPDYTSMPADSSGRFVLYVPEAGAYCLAARTSTRGQPKAGEPYGVLAGGEDACREVTAGEILEIGDIVLKPFR